MGGLLAVTLQMNKFSLLANKGDTNLNAVF